MKREILSSRFHEEADEITGEMVIKENQALRASSGLPFEGDLPSEYNLPDVEDVPAVPKNFDQIKNNGDVKTRIPLYPPRAPLPSPDELPESPPFPPKPFPPQPPFPPKPFPPQPQPPFPPKPFPPQPPFPFPPEPPRHDGPFFPPFFPPFTPKPPFPPYEGQRVVRLSRELYEDLRTLENYYSQLYMKAQTESERDIIKELEAQTKILVITSGQIYKELTGNNPPLPYPKMNLPRFFKSAVQFIQNFILHIKSVVVDLQRAVNIPSIDRQLVIISAVLTNQRDTLSTLI